MGPTSISVEAMDGSDVSETDCNDDIVCCELVKVVEDVLTFSSSIFVVLIFRLSLVYLPFLLDFINGWESILMLGISRFYAPQ